MKNQRLKYYYFFNKPWIRLDKDKNNKKVTRWFGVKKIAKSGHTGIAAAWKLKRNYFI